MDLKKNYLLTIFSQIGCIILDLSRTQKSPTQA